MSGGMRAFQDRVWSARPPAGAQAPEPGSRVAAALEELLRHPPDGLLVDLGCGDGALLARAPGPRLGIDLSITALARVAAGPPRLAADLDAPRLPLRDGCAAAAVLLDSLPYAAAPRRLLREVARVLAPGGLLLVSVPNAGQLPRALGLLAGRGIVVSHAEPLYDGGQRHLFTGPSLARLLDETGFACERLIGLLPAPAGSPPRRIASRIARAGVGRAWLAPGVLAMGRRR